MFTFVQVWWFKADDKGDCNFSLYQMFHKCSSIVLFNRFCCHKLKIWIWSSGPIFQAILLGFPSSRGSDSVKSESLPCTSRCTDKNGWRLVAARAARAVSDGMWQPQERVQKWESIWTKLKVWLTLIWCQLSSRTTGCVMAHSSCVLGTVWAKSKLVTWGENLDCSGHSARFLTFTRQCLPCQWAAVVCQEFLLVK